MGKDGANASSLVLPISGKRRELLELLNEYDVVLVSGETGCGKSTQLPQFLIDAKGGSLYRRVVVTQPRRLAAVSVAQRVASERAVPVGGDDVGYAVRFDDRSTPTTRIRFVTHGVLLREACSPQTNCDRQNELTPQRRFLPNYDVVVIDEVHERSVNTDLLLALTKTALRDNSGSFKLILMSATAHLETFKNYFLAAPKTILPLNISSSNKLRSIQVGTLQIPGRSYPVERLFTSEPVDEYVHAAVTACIQIHVDEELPGDVLCFLAGQDEIESACELATEHAIRYLGVARAKDELVVCALYASLSPDEQQRALRPLPKNVRNVRRKIIFATNVAETSLTLRGVRFVVDSGMCKQRVILDSGGGHALRAVPISQAQAAQRAGRAGRESSGKAFSLYTESALKTVMEEHETPEILRTDVASAVLTLLALGIDIRYFDFVDSPQREALADALQLLLELGALDNSCALTDLGAGMAVLPLPPMLARAQIEAEARNCRNRMAALSAVLSSDSSILVSAKASERARADQARKRLASVSGDHTSLLRIFDAHQDTPETERFAFCREHFVSHRALASAEAVQRQLIDLCSGSVAVQNAVQYLGRSNGPHEKRVKVSENPQNTSSMESDRLEQEWNVRQCILSGYRRHLMRLVEGSVANANGFGRSKSGKPHSADTSIALHARYTSINGGPDVHVHPASVLRWRRRPPPFVVYHELVQSSKKYMRFVLEIEPDWI
uniref:RNA helicase n=1 Tax=Timspurckia oligopyrenoides TaxID=708627 RepID=A0A7S0ZKY0_9RHOD|mmetsp:Transcript_9349/g.16850  ORF Transcript_9349/g.16850 Transcript_9349/m.16850 type:complete len:728 (+) Transcript_9349:55-2238(+)